MSECRDGYRVYMYIYIYILQSKFLKGGYIGDYREGSIIGIIKGGN